MKPIIDSFSISSRIMPAIATFIPGLVIWFMLIQDIEQMNRLSDYFKDLSFMEITMSVVLILLYSYIIRSSSKYFQRVYFNRKKGFPTTYFLLYENNQQYTVEFIKAYRQKLRDTFHLLIDENDIDETRIIKQLNVAQEHATVLIKDGYLVRKKLLWYCYYRNLVGGTIYGIIMSVIGLSYAFAFNQKELIILFAFLLLLYIILISIGPRLIISNAEEYARQLIVEFMMFREDKIKSLSKQLKKLIKEIN